MRFYQIVCMAVVLCVAAVAQAQYNGQLYGPANVDTGATDGNLNTPSSVSPTTNGNIRYQWRILGSGSGTAWVGFEWNSRTRVFSFYGNPTFTLADDVTIRGDMDIGGSAYGWLNPGNFGVAGLANTRRYIFNVTDSGTTLSTAPGNDQIQLGLTEINHTATLASTPDGAATGLSTVRSGNNIVLQTSSTAENSGSNEELWYQWTIDNFSNQRYVQDTAISANDSVSIPLSASAPILREGDELKWLLASTGPSTTGTISGLTGGLRNFDVIAINKSTVITTTIADDDSAAPVASAFSVANQTDAAVLAGGYTISGTLTDAGSGVNNAGATVSGNDFSPNFDILNDANTQVATDQLFTTRPADGANGTASAAAPAVSSANIDLGTYKVRVSATDNDEDPSTSANDRTALVDSQVTTFTVTDDDTTAPTHTSVTGNGTALSGASFVDGGLTGGLVVTGFVQDAQSGVYGGTSNRWTLFRNGATVTSGSFTPNFSDGGALGSAGRLDATIAAANVQTSGSYTLRVFSVNFDVDRTGDAETTTTDFQFTVSDDDTSAPVHSSFTGNGTTLSSATFFDVDLAGGLVVTGFVQDAQSGVYGGTSNRFTLFRNGATITSGGFTPNFSDGGALASAGRLETTLAAVNVQTVGSYTLRVFSVNYDIDRAGDSETTTTDIEFTVTVNVQPAIGRGPGSLTYTTMVGTAPASQTIGVTNVGGQTLLYTNYIAYGSGSGWLSVTPVTGSLVASASQNHTAAITVSGMAGSTYTATVTINGNQTNAAQTVSVTLNLTNIPAAGLTATADGAQMVRVTPTDTSGRQVLVVHRAGSDLSANPVNGTPYSVGGSLGGGSVVFKGAPAAFEHIVGSGATHYYRVYSINNDHYSAPTSANATTPSYGASERVETFSYTNAIGLQTQNGGANWSGAWTISVPRTNVDARIDSVNFSTFQSYWPAETGNRLLLATTNSSTYAAFRSFSAVNSGSIYVAALYRREFNEGGDGKFSGISFMNGSTEIAFVGEPGGAGNDDRFGVDAGGSPVTSGGNDSFPAGVDRLIIGRYDLASGTMQGIFYNSASAVPAAEPTYLATVSGTPAAQINGIRLASGASSGWNGETHFDEVRVATSWAALLNQIAPVVTNYSVKGGTQVTDNDIRTGSFAVEIQVYDPAGVQSSGSTPDIDLIGTNGAQLVGNQTFATRTFADNGRSLTASNSTFAAAGTNNTTLGTYTLRWSAINSNGFLTVNSTNQSNGSTLTFTVTDEDTTGPTNHGVLAGGYAMIFRLGPDGAVTNYYFQGTSTNTVVRIRDEDLKNVSASNPFRFIFAIRDDSGLTRSASGPLTETINYDIGSVATLQNMFGTYSASRSSALGSEANSTSVFYHTAAFTDSEVTDMISARSNIVAVSAPDADADRNTDDRTTSVNQQFGFFEVLDDDTNAPVASAFTAVNGTTYTVGDLAGGLVVTGLIADQSVSFQQGGSGVYGGTSNRYVLLRNGTQVDAGAFTTQPGANGQGLTTPASLAVTLSGAIVDQVGGYDFIVYSRDFDTDRAGDSLVGSNSFSFTVAASGCASGAPTLTQPSASYTIIEGNNLSFNVDATDTSGCPAPQFAVSGAPSGYSFNEVSNLNVRTGAFSWTPSLAQAGTYNVRFKATDSEALTTALVVRIYVRDSVGPEAVNGQNIPVSQTNFHVSITNIGIGSSGNVTLVFDSVTGLAYDIYVSDSTFGGAMSWSKLGNTVETPGEFSTNEVAASGSQRFYQVVPQGANPTSNGVWGVIRPTVNAATFTLVSAPLNGNRRFDQQFGRDLAAVLDGDNGLIMTIGDKVHIMEASQNYRTLHLFFDKTWRESNGSVSTYELSPGQGFYVQRNTGSSAQPRLTGPVGALFGSTGNLHAGWNIAGLSHGREYPFTSVFTATNVASGSIVGNWDETSADIVVIPVGGTFRRVWRTGDNTWLDLTTFATPNITLTPGAGYFYYSQGTVGFRF